MESIEDQLVGRLELGKERYGHGVIVNSDTREWGTPENSWINMCQEELLDAVIYIVADKLVLWNGILHSFWIWCFFRTTVRSFFKDFFTIFLNNPTRYILWSKIINFKFFNF
jgi:hypothetical protein